MTADLCGPFPAIVDPVPGSLSEQEYRHCDEGFDRHLLPKGLSEHALAELFAFRPVFRQDSMT